MDTAIYSCTSLYGTNKVGKLKPDANGYYPVVLGAFDFKNGSGENYPFSSVKQLFKSSSSLMRRIHNGQCHGELGHPRREPGMSYSDYIQRILEIHEDKISHHIRSVNIDTNSVKDENGKPIIAVIGDVRPSGPHGAVLKESMENPDENVCFSVRSLVKRSVEMGVVQKHIKLLITWDNVTQPGISVANKYSCPALESNDLDYAITSKVIDDIAANNETIAMENAGINIAMVRTELGWYKTQNLALPSMDW